MLATDVRNAVHQHHGIAFTRQNGRELPLPDYGVTGRVDDPISGEFYPKHHPLRRATGGHRRPENPVIVKYETVGSNCEDIICGGAPDAEQPFIRLDFHRRTSFPVPAENRALLPLIIRV